MKRKVAILLRGAISSKNKPHIKNTECVQTEYVKFDSCAISIKRHIVEYNSQIADFDFYIHCWNYDLQNELINLYNPIKSQFENNDYYLEEFEQAKKYFRMRAPLKTISQMSQALSIKKVIELIEHSEKSYDQVILYRPDVLLWKDMDLRKYDIDKIYVNGHETKCGNPNGDFHFVMNYENALEFKKLYDSVFTGNSPKPHYWINNYVVNYMKTEMIKDDILPPYHQEVLRKVVDTMAKNNESAFELGHITESMLSEYNLTLKDL